MWTVTGQQYEISAVVPQTSCHRETNDHGITKCQLFSQASVLLTEQYYLLQDLEGEREVNKDEVLEYCNSSDVNIPLIETSAKVEIIFLNPGWVFFSVWTVQYSVFNDFENFNTMKLSVNEAKLTCLWAWNCATIQQVVILIFAFEPKKFLGLLRNAPQITNWKWKRSAKFNSLTMLVN